MFRIFLPVILTISFSVLSSSLLYQSGLKYYCPSKKVSGICLPDTSCCQGTLHPAVCFSNSICCVGQNQCKDCPSGFKKSANGTCVDINECTTIKGVCSNQTCINLNGSFTCKCDAEFKLVDGTCQLDSKEDPALIFTTRRSISLAMLKNGVGSKTIEIKTIIFDLFKSTISIDYSLRGNFIIWTDVLLRRIYVAPLNESLENELKIKRQTVLIDQDVVTPDGVAIDWIHNLVYWTDTGLNTVNVANVFNASHRLVLANGTHGVDEPRAILVNPVDSFIIWSDWGLEAKIIRASQDGNNRQTLVDRNILWPNGLAFDLPMKRILWVDAKLGTISSIDFNGGDRIEILNSETLLRHPFNLDVFNDIIYFSDWTDNSILVTDKFGKYGDAKIRLFEKIALLEENPIISYTLMDLKIIHSSHQPDTDNRCFQANCSFLCLPNATDSYFCLCPDHKYLHSLDDCKSNSQLNQVNMQPKEATKTFNSELNNHFESPDFATPDTASAIDSAHSTKWLITAEVPKIDLDQSLDSHIPEIPIIEDMATSSVSKVVQPATDKVGLTDELHANEPAENLSGVKEQEETTDSFTQVLAISSIVVSAALISIIWLAFKKRFSNLRTAKFDEETRNLEDSLSTTEEATDL